ncbi:UNKNOWN [Stylonychia lemnae]|uniref:Uncharacterized protein n=1 Tax=Stylonychia lemnae TaxID=5949 RepID=A0A078AJ31_STYLE|nr:UNKNOWN [Stylonychia lemnae]|eukprot:CDW80813.1 UNKNOWN [Stylonychia lemnae]
MQQMQHQNNLANNKFRDIQMNKQRTQNVQNGLLKMQGLIPAAKQKDYLASNNQQRIELAEKKKIRRMNHQNAEHIASFIERRKLDEDQEIIDDPFYRNNRLERKLHKFLLKRQGKDQREMYQQQSNQPKDFEVQTLGSNTSSFSELSYYGDEKYLNVSPETVFENKFSNSYISSIKTDASSLKAKRPTLSTISDFQHSFVNATNRQPNDEKFNLLKKTQAALQSKIQNKNSTMSTNSGLQNQQTFSYNNNNNLGKIQPGAKSLLVTSILNKVVLSKAGQTQLANLQNSKTNANLGGLTSLNSLSKQLNKINDDINNDGSQRAMLSTRKKNSTRTNKINQPQNSVSQPGGEKNFLTMPMNSISNESFQSRKDLSSPKDVQVSTFDSKKIQNMVGEGLGKIMQGSKRLYEVEKKNTFNSQNSKGSKNSKNSKISNAFIDNLHLNTQNSTGSKLSKIEDQQKRSLSMGRKKTLAKQDMIPPLNLQKTLNNNHRKHSKDEDSFTRQIQMDEANELRHGITDDQLMQLINHTQTPPANEYEEFLQNNHPHHELLLDEQDTHIDHNVSSHFQPQSLSALSKYKNTKLFSEYNEWTQLEQQKSNQGDHNDYYFTSKLLVRPKPNKYTFQKSFIEEKTPPYKQKKVVEEGNLTQQWNILRTAQNSGATSPFQTDMSRKMASKPLSRLTDYVNSQTPSMFQSANKQKEMSSEQIFEMIVQKAMNGEQIPSEIIENFSKYQSQVDKAKE